MQVEELKQHIKVLQAVGYNALEGDEEEDSATARGQGQGAEGTSGRSLEALLLAKNRHLEHELTMARLQVADLTGQFCSQACVLRFCCIASTPKARIPGCLFRQKLPL